MKFKFLRYALIGGLAIFPTVPMFFLFIELSETVWSYSPALNLKCLVGIVLYPAFFYITKRFIKMTDRANEWPN